MEYQPLLKGKCMICQPSSWQDLSTRHKELREKMEQLIQSYVHSTSREYRVPIIVAPYGSGKSTLFKYLCCYCWKNGIPAIHVRNFNDIVKKIIDNLKNTGRNRIHESEVPEIIEKYFDDQMKNLLNNEKELQELSSVCSLKDDPKYIISDYLNNKIKGVLLIDEVEEAYHTFRSIVDYETSPFRELYDRVVGGSLKVFVIMAFGPSSIAKEAYQLAAGWRTLVYSLPLVHPDAVYDEVSKRVAKVDPAFKKWLPTYLTNMVWFASKGRYGWIHNIIELGIIEDIAWSLSQGNISSKTLFQPSLYETMEKHIIKGIKLFDLDQYENYLNRIKREYQNLFKILACLVGPIEIGKLRAYVDVDLIESTEIDKSIFVKGDLLIDLNDLTIFVGRIAEKIAMKILPPDKHDEVKDIVKNITKILDIVFTAWSFNKQILVGRKHDINYEALKYLKDLASSQLLEIYQPTASTILDKIDFSKIIKDLIRQGRYYVSDETLVAIHPRVLYDIYPPLILNPLVACSKHDLGSIYMRSLDDYMYLVDRFHEILGINLLGDILNNTFIIPYIPELFRIEEGIADIILRAITSGKYVILLPVARKGDEIKRLAEDLKDKYGYLEDLGLVTVVADISDRLGLFMYGLLYSIDNCNEELEELRSKDRMVGFIIEQYAKVYRDILQGVISSFYQRLAQAEAELRGIFAKYNDLTYSLLKRSGKGLGEKQAKYFWLMPIGEPEIRDKFIQLIETISRFSEPLARLENGLSKIYGEIALVNIAFTDLKLLSNATSSLNYLNMVLKLYESLNNEKNSNRLLEDYLTTLEKAVYYKLDEIPGICDVELHKIMRRVIRNFPKPLALTEFLLREDPKTYSLIGRILRDYLSANCRFKPGTSLVGHVRSQLTYFKNDLMQLIERISHLSKLIRDYSGGGNILVEELEMLRPIIDEIIRLVDELIERYRTLTSTPFIEKLDYYSYKLLREFIIKNIVEKFVENLVKASEKINMFSMNLLEIENSINEIKETIDELVRAYSQIFPEIREELGRDIGELFSSAGSIKDLRESVSQYIHGLKRLREELKIIQKYNELVSKKNKLIDMINEIILGSKR